MSAAQIIHDETGAPAFVVIPYAQFRAFMPEAALSDEALFDVAMAEKDRVPAVPQVVMARLLDGENPVKVYREWQGLTQGDLAVKVGVSPGFISQVERGKRGLSRKARAAAAAVLDVLPDDLETE